MHSDELHRLLAGVDDLVSLPRGAQPAALNALLTSLPPLSSNEEWNTEFGSNSLFDAWTRNTLTQSLYQANAKEIRAVLSGRQNWRIIEIGGGDGRLWGEALGADDRGELLVIDPVAAASTQVAQRLPGGVKFQAHTGLVQEFLGDLPDADLVVCSLTLHHVAGEDSTSRTQFGLPGPGKLEVLKALSACLAARAGVGLINEANIFCDLQLAPGDPVLVSNLLDSYVRRTAVSLCDDIRNRSDADDDLRARWGTIMRRWCLEQVNLSQVSRSDRDVYELDVPRWEDLLRRAGFVIQSRSCTDVHDLFYQYVVTPSV